MADCSLRDAIIISRDSRLQNLRGLKPRNHTPFGKRADLRVLDVVSSASVSLYVNRVVWQPFAMSLYAVVPSSLLVLL